MSVLLKMFSPDDSTDMTSLLNGKKGAEHNASEKTVLSYCSLEELNTNTLLLLEIQAVKFCYGRKYVKTFVGYSIKIVTLEKQKCQNIIFTI